MAFNSTIKRVGFACKWVEINKKNELVSVKGLNTGTTTIAWLNRQPKHKAEEKLWELMKNNIQSTHNLIKCVSKLEPELRMVRLTSDILTAYSHENWRYFYQQPDVVQYMEKYFAPLGETARVNDVRLSMHPGQFCVLASANSNIVNNSIAEFEYHSDMARMMGYGKKFQDFKINVHISGNRGPQGIKDVMSRLSPEAKNMITIENSEFTWGIDASLTLVDTCALVVDLHHHWINTGEYIEANDDRIKRVIDSWRGVRPVIHYSVSKDIEHDLHSRPDLSALIAAGYKKQHLRCHSTHYWNTAVNEWAFTHYEWADIMAESKGKNIASNDLFTTIKGKHNVE